MILDIFVEIYWTMSGVGNGQIEQKKVETSLNGCENTGAMGDRGIQCSTKVEKVLDPEILDARKYFDLAESILRLNEKYTLKDIY